MTAKIDLQSNTAAGLSQRGLSGLELGSLHYGFGGWADPSEYLGVTGFVRPRWQGSCSLGVTGSGRPNAFASG